MMCIYRSLEVVFIPTHTHGPKLYGDKCEKLSALGPKMTRESGGAVCCASACAMRIFRVPVSCKLRTRTTNTCRLSVVVLLCINVSILTVPLHVLYKPQFYHTSALYDVSFFLSC